MMSQRSGNQNIKNQGTEVTKMVMEWSGKNKLTDSNNHHHHHQQKNKNNTAADE